MPLALSEAARRYAQWGTEVSLSGAGAVLAADLVAWMSGSDGVKREKLRLRGADTKLLLPGGIELGFPSAGGTFARIEDITGGGGDVVGPASSTNNDVALFDGVTGKLLKDGGTFLSLMLANDGPASGLSAEVTAKATVADAAGDTTTFIGLWGAATGDLPPLTDSGLAYNASTNVLTLLGTGTGTALLGPWATNNAWYALGMSGSLADGGYSLKSSPASQHLDVNAPTSHEIRLRINDDIQVVVAAGEMSPSTAGFASLGRANLGWDGITLDGSGVGNDSVTIVGGAVASNITLTTPVTTGTLALTTDIAATVDKAFVDALNVDADTLDGIDSLAFGLVASPLSQFAATTSAQLRGVLSDESGDGAALFQNGDIGVATGTSLTLSSLTSGRVPYATTAGLLTDSANLTFDGSLLRVIGQVRADEIRLTADDKIHFDDNDGGGEYSLYRNSSGNFILNRNIGAFVGTTGQITFDGAALSYSLGNGGGHLGTVDLGWGSLYLEEPGGGDTAQIITPALGSDIVLTTPAATGTLATLAGTETLTNKTLGTFVLSGDMTTPGGGGFFPGTNDFSLYADESSASIGVFSADAGDDNFLYKDDAGNEVIRAYGAAGTFPDTLELRPKISKYNNITTVSNGVPALYGEANITARTSAITTGTLYTPPTAGFYRVSFAITLTTAATVSSVLGAGVNLNYTSGDGATAKVQNVPMHLATVTTATTDSGDTSNAVGATLIGWTTVYAGAVAMTYDVGYTSVGATAMQYAARVRAERL